MRRFTKLRGLEFLAIFTFIVATCAFGAPEGSKEVIKETDSSEQNAPLERKRVLTDLELRMQKTITVDFRDTPIDDVLRIMAEQADVDIVKSPNVTGGVTARLTNVPLEEALDNILAAHGYGYVLGKNMLRVAPIGEISISLERLVNKIYRITYADVKEVEISLEKFLSARGSISSNVGSSNIIVTDTESKIKAIDTFVEEIDRITPQILVETRIYDISSKDRFELGFEWSAGRNTNFGSSGITGIGGNPSGRTNPFISSAFDSAISQTAKTDGLIRFGILNSSLDIDAMFTANQEKICAILLANPRILVLDNETATFKIIEERPFQELTQTAGGGSIGTTAFKEIGVELEVTPHVASRPSKDEPYLIRLHLKSKFSVQTDSVEIAFPQTGGDPITSPQPVIDKREAESRILIQDGQTIVLGGLRKKNITQEMSKIPLLGDLPLIGGLFRFEGEETINSELVIFITPRIIINPTLSPTEQKYLEATDMDMCTPNCPPTKIRDCGR